MELYTKLNDRLKDVEVIHRERVEVVRRSFKQQLQDALVLMATKYKKHYEAKLSGELYNYLCVGWKDPFLTFFAKSAGMEHKMEQKVIKLKIFSSIDMRIPV